MRSTLALVACALCCAAADPVLHFSTYLGGIDKDLQPAVAVAADGSIFVALTTNSPDLPVSADAAQKALAPGTCMVIYWEFPIPARCFDVYVAKLSPSGEILRATYLGGSGWTGQATSGSPAQRCRRIFRAPR